MSEHSADRVPAVESIADRAARLSAELEARTTELTEALERQTATAEILRVMSGSANDIAPVFETILENSARLCDGPMGSAFRFDGKLVHLVATKNWPEKALARIGSKYPQPPNPHVMSGRTILTGEVCHIEDTLSDPTYDRAHAVAGGWRRMLGVPLLRDGTAVGAIVVTWPTPGKTPERHVALLRTFADQAVIAIENVRLFKEIQEKSQQLEEANRAKSRFFAAASHDLRQPLHAMALFVSALKEQNREADSPRILDQLTASVEALAGLFDALLDVSKLDAGVVRPEIRDFPVQAVFDRIGRECATDAADKGLRMRLVPTRTVVRSDTTLLERILRNFVSNAIRCTSAGGVVVGCRRRGDAVRIAVYDTGVGIESTHLANIFQEFFQVGNPERDRSKGLGLGLAIVDRLARLLDHPVGVVSVPGRGSVFSITTPRGESASAEQNFQQPVAAIEGNLGGALVVVIDDEVAVRDGMREVMQQWGCQPLLAGSVDEALAQLARTALPPAAVIADYRLRAGETGIGAIGRIRSAYGADIPGVIITGDTASERLREAEAGGYHLLHKPVRPVRLRALLSFLLSA